MKKVPFVLVLLVFIACNKESNSLKDSPVEGFLTTPQAG